MWKSMPPWAMAAIPAIPFFALVLLQENGGSESLQKITALLFFVALLFVTYLIRVRKREVPTTPTPPKKILLSSVVWLVVILILALVWANSRALFHIFQG
jgi:hypothetical protein